MKKTFVLMVVLSQGLIGCASSPTPIPNAGSVAANLYAEKCSACHAVPHPKRNNASEWQHLLTLMEQRMNERGMDALTNEQRKTILAYLQTNAR